MFNDIDIFRVDAIDNEGNKQMVRNLVNFTTQGTRNQGKVVWFDRGHNSECGIRSDCDDNDLSKMRSVIEEASFTITEISSTSGSIISIPSDVKAIFLWLPTVAYTLQEINTFKKFAAEGGRIVFIGEHDQYYTGISVQNRFLKGMGAVMRNTGGDIKEKGPASGNLLRPHQVTNGVTSIAYNRASAVELGPNDYPLFFNATGKHVLAGVASIDINPIVCNTTITNVETLIQKANLCEELRLAKGTYILPSCLVFNTSTTLIGAGIDKTFIKSSTGGCLLFFSSNEKLSLSKLSLENTGNKSVNLLAASGGNINIDKVSFKGAKYFKGDSFGGGGLSVENAKVTVKNGFFENNLIAANPNRSTTMNIEDSVFKNNQFGIDFRSGSSGTVKNNRIENLKGFKQYGENQYGILAGGTSRPNIENNNINNNEYGIVFYGSTTAQVFNNTINKNTNDGIWMAERSKAVIRTNTITNNGSYGIFVKPNSSANPTIENNTFSGNAKGDTNLSENNVLIEDLSLNSLQNQVPTIDLPSTSMFPPTGYFQFDVPQNQIPTIDLTHHIHLIST